MEAFTAHPYRKISRQFCHFRFPFDGSAAQETTPVKRPSSGTKDCGRSLPRLACVGKCWHDGATASFGVITRREVPLDVQPCCSYGPFAEQLSGAYPRRSASLCRDRDARAMHVGRTCPLRSSEGGRQESANEEPLLPKQATFPVPATPANSLDLVSIFLSAHKAIRSCCR